MELSQDGKLELADNVVAQNLISRDTLVIKDNYRIVELNLQNFGTSTQKYIRLCPRLSNNCFRGTFFCSRTSSGNSDSFDGKITASFSSSLVLNICFTNQASSFRLSCNVVRNNDFLYLLINTTDVNRMPRFITFYAETNGHDIIGDNNPSGIVSVNVQDNGITKISGRVECGAILSSGDVSSTGIDQVTKFRVLKSRNTSQYAIGEYVLATHTSRIDRNDQVQVRLSGNAEYIIGSGGTQLQGGWQARGCFEATRSNLTTRFAIMCQRFA